MAIKNGDKIKITYTGKFEDGQVFDSSNHGDHDHPLEFEVGAGKVIKGLDEAVLGMEKDQEKEVKVSKDKGYGDRNEQLIVSVPKDKIPSDKEIAPGTMLIMGTPDGRQIPAVVKNVGEGEVTVDMNHPLAGRDLIFNFKIVEVSSA